MTHEYVIAVNGRIHAPAGDGTERPTAIAWAAEHVLAVGADAAVRSISRGDSTFIDLAGCTVTALPDDPEAAAAELASAPATIDVNAPGELLLAGGWLPPGAALEPGSPADLAFWQHERPPGPGDAAGTAGAGGPGLRLVAMVRGGAFVAGDPHRGPFGAPPDDAQSGA